MTLDRVIRADLWWCHGTELLASTENLHLSYINSNTSATNTTA